MSLSGTPEASTEHYLAVTLYRINFENFRKKFISLFA